VGKRRLKLKKQAHYYSLGAVLAALVVTTAIPLSAQAPAQPKVEMGACKGPSQPVGELHPGDKFIVCVRFDSDLLPETNVTLNFNLPTPNPSAGGERTSLNGYSMSGNEVVQDATKNVDIPITVSHANKSGVFILSLIQANVPNIGPYNYTLPPEQQLKVPVKNSDEYNFPAIQSVGIKADKP
jgi:hypothetical protein